ncbi:MAG: hypothetical protein LBS16_07620 [Prevotellaceae bacterium]|nr:hypothetical protein [Prevotellaceae bacterium]
MKTNRLHIGIIVLFLACVPMMAATVGHHHDDVPNGCSSDRTGQTDSQCLVCAWLNTPFIEGTIVQVQSPQCSAQPFYAVDIPFVFSSPVVSHRGRAPPLCR